MEIQIFSLSSSVVLPFPSQSGLAFRPLTPPPRATTSTTTTTTSTTTPPPHSQSSSSIRVMKIRKDSNNSFSARNSAKLEIQQASHLPSALARVGEILTVKDLNAILHHFGNANISEHASQLFSWMQENDKLDASSYSHYMRKGKLDTSLKLFQQMKEDGLVPDVVTYSTLLSGCIKVNDRYPKALELIQELQHNELQMDGVIYGAILAVCASNSKLEEAEYYFNKMKNEGQAPNVYHYSSLLNAYSACGNYKKADMLVKQMKSEGLVPNKVILTTLLKVYVKGGLFEKSRESLAELKSLGYAEDEMPYCILMDGLAKAGQFEEAKLTFDEMIKNNVKSDGYAHSIMISAYCRAKLFREAKQLANDFEATSDKYDIVILNSMLCAFCRAGEMESVMETLRKMDKMAISPDYKTFNILIKYFCREKMYPLAFRTMEDMISKGYQPAEELCSTLIYHLGRIKAYVEAFSVYNMLKYSKRTMCKATHEKILHILLAGNLLKDAYVVVKDNATYISRAAIRKFACAFLKSGNINLMNDVMKTLQDSGYKIDQDLFQMAISRYLGHPEKKDLLLHLLQWMPGQGYVLDSSTRNLILKNSHLFGRQLIAEVLSKQKLMSKSHKPQ
ncbi:pentatricopeptide repeat-containing protein At1g10910, chloroplastic isoform X2 [Arachis hypogaea]|uniref:pentatricopeptide repeat-containing protein At1g10910, chloroplastic isoform X2 n=1 Tax=Arachis hypogaea TaxID=3818 RepID=UPI003B221072